MVEYMLPSCTNKSVVEFPWQAKPSMVEPYSAFSSNVGITCQPLNVAVPVAVGSVDVTREPVW